MATTEWDWPNSDTVRRGGGWLDKARKIYYPVTNAGNTLDPYDRGHPPEVARNRNQSLLNEIALYSSIPGYENKAQNLRDRATRQGLNLTNPDGTPTGDARGFLDKLANSGDPAYAKIAAHLGGLLDVGEAAGKARTSADTEIAGGWGAAEDQFRSALDAPYDPNSGAALATAASYTAGRRGSLFDAMNKIEQDAANSKTKLDFEGFSAIGDTLATLKALKQQEQLAKMQMWIQGGSSLMQSGGSMASMASMFAGV